MNLNPKPAKQHNIQGLLQTFANNFGENALSRMVTPAHCCDIASGSGVFHKQLR